ncbi:MAG TPA: Na(+)/H(+) antiporter subunit D [Verrucomicrobiales bacterium]|nr:Na(+)/H(+) antiporter subunit D [Verrucomicrobiales bacterium]HIL70971.1 Na(+)/H(+) antiporter subunit D [Verrucomicrobiota bacterium]
MRIDFPPGFLLFLTAALIALFGRNRKITGIIAVTGTLLTLAAVLSGIRYGLGELTFQFVGDPQTGEPLRLNLLQQNAPTSLFAAIFALMAFGGVLYSLHKNSRVELSGALFYAGSALCAVYAGDLVTLFICWELMAVGSTLVVLVGGQKHSRNSAMRYALVHFGGGVCFMAGITLYLVQGGSAALDSNPLSSVLVSYLSELNSLSSWLILIGVLINAGAPPFGAWLPDAYPEASETGMVFLSAFTTKTAVYVLMMLFAGAEILIYTGMVMAVYGIVYAILENDMRRILAYSIINQVGFMVCGIGIGSELALSGTAAHAFAHIIYKALLLMSAGSVLTMTGKRKCTDLGGLYQTMPVTMVCGIIGALAISAAPLTSGFTTKSMITSAAGFEAANTASAGSVYVLAWYVLTAASAGVFLHAGIKFPWFVFFQKDSGLRPPDPPINMKAAMVFFSGLCVLFGVWTEPVYSLLPFPPMEAHGDGVQTYNAWTVTHVLDQLQLLVASGVAFFLLLPLLKRTLTVTLDFDYIYRKCIPMFWHKVCIPLYSSYTGLVRGVFSEAERLKNQLTRISVKPDASGHQIMRAVINHDWPVGRIMTLVTLLLFLYLFLLFLKSG